jgi:type IV pilus assembly protein PilY1
MRTFTQDQQHNRTGKPFHILAILLLCFCSQNVFSTDVPLATSPLFLSNSTIPLVMLNISKDTQLYFKAYDDYSDLNGDGIPDTTYSNSIVYYGYFDSYKCYLYNTTTARFEPNQVTTTMYCPTGQSLWSGNFLNWATMSRIDTIRKILYGGYRSTDTGSTYTTSTSSSTGSTTTTGTPTTTSTSSQFGQVIVTSNGSSTSTSYTGSCKKNSGTGNAGPTNTICDSSVQNNSVQSTANSSTTTGAPSSVTAASGYTTTVTTTTVTTNTYTAVSTQYSLTSASTSSSTTSHHVTTTTTTTTYTLNTTVIQTPTTVTTTATSVSTTQPTPGTTVLQRTYIPNDGHSFAKYYNGSDLSKLTPFSSLTGMTSAYISPCVSGDSNCASSSTSCAAPTLNANGTYSTPNPNCTAVNTAGITICNTTASTTTLSENVTDPPLIRVAQGNYSLWAANERWQCRWSQEISSTANSNGYTNNGNNSAISNIYAYPVNPSSSSFGSGVQTQFNAQVEVCVPGLIGTENCKTYTNNTTAGLSTLKPIGLLQTYGDNNQLYFGLLTGSYGKNKSGGVLRKNISSMNNEINVNIDGTFLSPPSTGGIINTLNILRMYGYCHSDGTYFCTTGADNCSWGLTSFTDGSCSNWGNPISEMYLESLNYFSNFGATSAFNSNDTSYFPGLTTATTIANTSATPPVSVVPSAQWCSKLSLIEFNASSSSYDGDQLSGASNLNGNPTLNTLTNAVGTGEGIPGKSFFVGSNSGFGTSNSSSCSSSSTISNQLCTGKTVSNLSCVSGTCPDAPRLSGTYQIDGLSWFGHTNDLLSSIQGTQSVTAYGVALAPKLPVVTVAVPGSTKNITIIPACQNSSLPGNCTEIDFKIVSQSCAFLGLPTTTGTNANNCGLLYVNWEDSEQGGDFDMDMWGVLQYYVTPTHVQITTQTIYQSTPYQMGFGYILGGTTNDGFHVHSGINAYAYTDPNPGTLVTGSNGTGTNAYCVSCNPSYGTNGGGIFGPGTGLCLPLSSCDVATTVSYTIGSTSASSLQQPLWYAAKWGGFNDYNNTGTPDSTAEWDTNNDGIPNNYFYATNPSSLAASLAAAFNDVLGGEASSSSLAANSTSLQTGTVIYQAQFNSVAWNGHLFNFTVQPDGTITNVDGHTPLDAGDANWDAASLIPAQANRNIYTYNPTGGGSGTGSGVPFQWPASGTTTLSTAQTLDLNTNSAGVVDNLGQLRLNWLRGDSTYEVRFLGGVFRNRTLSVLGDIVDSSPVYTQSEDYGYSGLPSTAPEQPSYATYLTAKSSRIPMVYDGANDGMLHGFRADVGNSNSGVELMAYVPNGVFPNLSSLTNPGYTHKYYVDGSPNVNDAWISGAWKTVLLGGLNDGGNAIYALDVSNPGAFTASNVLWEYSGSTTADTGSTGVIDSNGLGLTYAEPQVARMNDGSWVAIFGNGYNSVSQQAFLYIVNLSTGQLIKKIPTNSNTSNGLSTAALYDINGDKIIDVAYAGDLQGNLWKFDLSESSSAEWGLGNGGQPLFTAINSSSQVQPITSKPMVAANPMGGQLIYFGTGSYLTIADISNTNTQSFYAIYDKPSVTGAVTRSNLVQQSLTQVVAAGTANPNANCPTSTTTTSTCISSYAYNYRSVSTNTVNYATARGWYLDLTPGERVVSAPTIENSMIIFLTDIPSSDPCVPGGSSWLMELDELSGGATASSPFDLNNDGTINGNDVLPNGAVANGVQTSVGMATGFVYLTGQTGSLSHIILTGSNAGMESLNQQNANSSSSSSGSGKNTSSKKSNTTPSRVYWMQIQ